MKALITLALVVCLPLSAASRPRVKPPRASTAGPASPRGPASERDRLQKILSLEDHRAWKSPMLVNYLRASSPSVVRAAVLALGRIGDPSGLVDMGRLMNSRDRELKELTAFSLGLIGSDTAVKFITQNLAMQTEPEVIAALLRALGRAGTAKTIGAFSDYLKPSANKALVVAACQGVGMSWNQDGSEKWELPPTLLAQIAKLAQSPEPVGPSCAFALSRYRGEPSTLPVSDLLAALRSPSDPARAFVVKTLARAVSQVEVAKALAEELSKESFDQARAEAAKGLASAGLTPEIVAALRKGLSDPISSVAALTLQSIGQHGTAASALSEAVTSAYQGSPSRWVRGSALKTLAQIQPIAGLLEANTVLNVPTAPLFPYAILALGVSRSTQDAGRLADLLRDSNLKVAVRAAQALESLPESSFTPLLKSALREGLQRSDPALASMTADLARKFLWKDFAPPLAAVYPLFTDPDAIDAKVSILGALAVIGDHAELDLAMSALSDDSKPIVEAAVQTVKALGGKDESARIPPNSEVTGKTPDLREALSAAHTKIVLTTSRGRIVIALDEQAPLTSLNFVKLVKKKFYDGTSFHRIVPGFVTQGGDPRGDGYGGPGYVIREEWSPIRHERGSVGMATAGKDTGGSQFFINLAPNYHLDGRYTVFGEVVEGMEVADKLEPDDKILSARPLNEIRKAELPHPKRKQR